jgi:hypothetical protein
MCVRAITLLFPSGPLASRSEVARTLQNSGIHRKILDFEKLLVMAWRVLYAPALAEFTGESSHGYDGDCSSGGSGTGQRFR